MIHVDDRPPVWTVTIAAEARRNALTRRMVADLLLAVERFEADASARVLTLTGAGSVAFSSGGDVKEMAADAGTAFVPVLPIVYERIIGLTKPVVAVLNGDAVGGGFELALACDVIIARLGVRVGLPEVGLGTVARYGTALLARQIGPQGALQLALLGGLHTIEHVTGIAARIVEPDDLAATTDDITRRLAALSPKAVTATKVIARRSAESTIAELVESPEALAAVHSEERQRAVGAFGTNRGGPKP